MSDPNNPFPAIPGGQPHNWQAQPGGPGGYPPPPAWGHQPQPGAFPPQPGQHPGFPPHNPYAQQPGYPPQGFGQPGFGQPAWGSERDQLRAAFIGSNAQHYLAAFQKIEATGSKANFNIAAFFLSIFWLAYRKLYVHAAGAAAIMLVPALLMMLIVQGSSRSATFSTVFAIVSVAVAVAIGMMGDSLVKKRADDTLAQVQDYPDPHSRMAAAAAAGGTSVVAGVGAWMVWTIVVVTVSLSTR